MQKEHLQVTQRKTCCEDRAEEDGLLLMGCYISLLVDVGVGQQLRGSALTSGSELKNNVWQY